jgi:4-diphosphocytidyl-2-C-methyl-D-erythritol kinase
MIVFPNAKINIGLFVTEKRPDGYHNLETVFVPIKGFCDVLEVLTNDGNSDEFTTTGLHIDAPSGDNLCMKAVKLMRTYVNIPPLKIHLHKAIPSGAGLGGGSADASFMLTLLNEQYNVGLSSSKLEKMASTLGADCAIFIKNEPVLAKGIGNEFYACNLSLSGCWIKIIVPSIHVATSTAFSRLNPSKASYNLENIHTLPIEEWKNNITNDFEASVFTHHPEIKKIKEALYNQGAIYASMSGSGSSVYGIFDHQPQKETMQGYTIHIEERK